MKYDKFLFYAGLIIVAGALFAAASFIGKAQNGGDTARQPGTALTENDFVKDPFLFAVPDAGVAVTFLENPNSISEPDDTGTVGMDIIPFKYASGMNQTFCWQDDNKESRHFMTIVDGSGTEVLRVEANGDCVTQFINQGNYEMRIQHDDSTEEVFATVFSIPEENADNSSETTLSTNKCEGCDLSGADFSNAILTNVDLHGADLTAANLSNADLSGANLSDTLLAGADLRGANLTNANLGGADLSGAKFGSAVGIAVTRPAEQPELAQEEPEAADPCPAGNLRPTPVKEDMQDLVLNKACNVPAGVYQYGEINIVKGGSLTFMDEKIHFWAKSILIENGGSLNAGFNPVMGKIMPIGTNPGGQVTIHLYGDEMDKAGITCKSPNQTSAGSCVPSDAGVKINKMDVINPASCDASPKLPGGVQNECFYEYRPPDDMAGETGFFGRKVLAVSFGGTLRLFGLKGATYKDMVDNWDSGMSWVRLRNDRDAKPDKTIINLDRDVDWEKGDRIVVTTTDYLPGHSEELQIVEKMTKRKLRVTIINPETNKPPAGCDQPEKNQKICGLQYLHNGDTYPDQGFNFQSDFLKSQDLKIELRNGGMDNGKKLAETRAAVALLTRSIRVVSGGKTIPTDQAGLECTDDCFPVSDGYFGGHLMIRQGFEEAKIQGVEFDRLGQGGRKARYPVHYHLVRTAPEGTFAKDNSVYDSMTRCYTLHGTQGVLLARNVCYLSIGHQYYIEDGTETDNKLYSNIGILARAAIDNKQNPRKVPGILAYTADKLNVADAPFHSDYAQPTVFWIMNGWNDFEYNMAAGANACGACYWWVPGEISGPSRKMKWFSYASEQSAGRGGITPLKNFMGNYCSSAMNAFNSIRDTSPCNGVGGPPPTNPVLEPVTAGNLSPKPPNQGGTDLEYYPILAGDHKPTRCPGGDKTDCSKTPPTCAAGAARKDCTVPVIDRFTTAFTWPETNFAAIWLRPQWYLVINSVISDVQNAGLTFVTGGDYTESNFVPGQWQLARQNVFIGQTQPDPPGGEPNYVSDAGPVNASTKLVCEDKTDKAKETLYCLLRDEGITFPLSSFANNQRLFSIYDGPSFEDSNAFFKIKKAFIDDCKFNPTGSGNCETSQSMYGRVLGMPYDEKDKKCFLPNAAIGWKQPNGFYYPPAFHSSNLYFHKDVDIRHFVIEPLFEPGIKAFKSWDKAVKENYCTWAVNNPMGFGGSFNNFSAIDRQTILNDDDGSLTGLKNTISVNQDQFFKAPTETIECRSGEVGTDEELKKGTAKTSPYDYVTTVVYPGCVEKGDCGGHCAKDMKPCAIADNCAKTPPGNDTCVIDENWFWHSNCGSNFCYGVPLYRQLLTKDEASNKKGEEIRMMGMDFFQRSNLTANNGVYYIDTTVSKAKQEEGLLRRGDPLKFNVFKGSAAGDKYYVLLIFAKETTKQTYQIYVGKDRKEKIEDIVKAIRSPLKSSKPLDVMPTEWPDQWDRTYNEGTGILEVTMDFKGFEKEFDDATIDRCKPESFCKWSESAGKCECSPELEKTNLELSKQCAAPLGTEKRTICDWAVRALDCPKGGCYGFSFTLTQDPPAEPLDPPAPCCFPGPPQFPGSPWNVKFVTVGEKIAGACSNTPHPDPGFCSNAPPCPTPTPSP